MKWVTSSACSGGNCLEVAFQTSSACADNTCVEVGYATSSACADHTCVEVGHGDGVVFVRNSQRRDAVVTFDVSEWEAFLTGVGRGEFRFPIPAVTDAG